MKEHIKSFQEALLILLTIAAVYGLACYEEEHVIDLLRQAEAAQILRILAIFTDGFNTTRAAFHADKSTPDTNLYCSKNCLSMIFAINPPEPERQLWPLKECSIADAIHLDSEEAVQAGDANWTGKPIRRHYLLTKSCPDISDAKDFLIARLEGVDNTGANTDGWPGRAQTYRICLPSDEERLPPDTRSEEMERVREDLQNMAPAIPGQIAEPNCYSAYQLRVVYRLLVWGVSGEYAPELPIDRPNDDASGHGTDSQNGKRATIPMEVALPLRELHLLVGAFDLAAPFLLCLVMLKLLSITHWLRPRMLRGAPEDVIEADRAAWFLLDAVTPQPHLVVQRGRLLWSRAAVLYKFSPFFLPVAAFGFRWLLQWEGYRRRLIAGEADSFGRSLHAAFPDAVLLWWLGVFLCMVAIALGITVVKDLCAAAGGFGMPGGLGPLPPAQPPQPPGGGAPQRLLTWEGHRKP